MINSTTTIIDMEQIGHITLIFGILLTVYYLFTNQIVFTGIIGMICIFGGFFVVLYKYRKRKINFSISNKYKQN